MRKLAYFVRLTLPLVLLVPALDVAGQQPPPADNGQQLAPRVAANRGAAAPQPQAPPEFQLNALEDAYLQQVLEKWETESGKIQTFRCDFERWDYNPVFAPDATRPYEIPYSKDRGELSYQKPDKGRFQITEVRRWQTEPVAPGGPPPREVRGDWQPNEQIVGEHWVCDGENVYEYRHDQKQLVVRPIPPELQGQSIVDGPLPFLFGAEATKLRQRYWLKVEQQDQNANQIWLLAQPKFRADAANYRQVLVSLDRNSLLPVAMQVTLPDSSRHTYIFDLANATVNDPFAKLKNLFNAPAKPLGWKRVVEPAAQEAQQQPPPRNASRPSRGIFGR